MPPRPATAHTRGPKCRLAPVVYPDPAPGLEGIPPINGQFFYSSPIPIDDPLSTPTIVASADVKSAQHPIRPFSPGDNNVLEKAWLALSSADCRRNHRAACMRHEPSPALVASNRARLAAIVDRLAVQHGEKHAKTGLSVDLPPSTALDGSGIPTCCPELAANAATELQTAFCSLARRTDPSLDTARLLRQVVARLRDPTSTPDSTFAAPPNAVPAAFPPVAETRPRAMPSSPRAIPPPPVAVGPVAPPRASLPDDGISGQPFLRVGAVDLSRDRLATPLADAVSRPDGTSDSSEGPPRRGREVPSILPPSILLPSTGKCSDDIPVGISRLHMVSLPGLQMRPIYWSPVNDIAVVLRATWFYRDTCLPVDAAVANQLESGYRELRPWTETWADELRCAVEVGPPGEEKISHPLWPPRAAEGLVKKHPTRARAPVALSDPFCAARCFHGEAAAEGNVLGRHGQGPGELPTATRAYASYHVIYTGAISAFLLKPSLKPSAYYGRRPVGKLVNGTTVGIPVVRGFDRSAWSRLQEKPTISSPPLAALARDHGQPDHDSADCPGCRTEEERGQVTDLVLVAHGVGQKLAERVESFHFTHAINTFRRDVNLSLGSDPVKTLLREDVNGIMVLPVNWRSTVSFLETTPDDVDRISGYGQEQPSLGAPMGAPTGAAADELARPGSFFSLKDIEPGSIPAVRSLISDVMLDIPFYMSNLKPVMIRALVSEANRIYRLWARNNPGFAEKGRVHLIAHSLGSAMAIDILSRQPTTTPRLDLSQPFVQPDYFEFDTKNLFLLGSPAGFFLLLERGRLLPRRGRAKPGADPADTVARGVVGEQGTFGCLAVDNIYNILAKEDPIAYLLNGTIDAAFASGLKVAYLPSSTMTLMASIGKAVRGYLPAASPSGVDGAAAAKPSIARLPSQVELEVHDFTREEIAEKKAHLLNDNGQIDYFLRSGGGPLEIQYLNMLGAHTSYWTNKDFIAMLCTEIGRRPGRENTLPAMRAMKLTKRFVRGSEAVPP